MRSARERGSEGEKASFDTRPVVATQDGGGSNVRIDEAIEMFSDPPREFGVIPFWFWNDDLEEAELVRQLRLFHEAGFGGVMPHARIGLSRRVGYLTDEYFRLMRVVVDEAARLEMKVILYDEGSYPSGSANGAVVAENAEYASQSLRLWDRDFEGPYSGFWRPNTGRALLDKHVCTVLGRVDDDEVVDPTTLRVLEPRDNTIFRVDIGDGRWKGMSVWNTASGGVIRGAFPESEDAHATAPPAGDILNPEAVACFLRLTHDRYYETLKDHFGTTVIAMFTDEPNVSGRGASRRGGRRAYPYTPGFVAWLSERWGEDPSAWLPALWMDYGAETEAFRHRYDEAVQTRLQEVFYGGQAAWCADHGIALTGHPAESNELTALRLFQLPGQDMVWRYVEPNKPTALEGDHSVAAKAATSGARLSNRRRVLTEVCGAYGWQLTLDEVKWLFDWHMVRGNNLINPHAVFYSIRDRRAWESEPDLAIHNVWWPYFRQIALYSRRLCWLLSDGEHVCDVAILGDGNHLPWRAAKQLYQRQIDFLYLDERAVSEAVVDEGCLVDGAQRYRVVVIDGLDELTDAAGDRLDAFKASGGTVIVFSEDVSLPDQIDEVVDPDVVLDPPDADLRCIHYRKDGIDHHLLVNEGEETIESVVSLRTAGHLTRMDPMDGSASTCPSRFEGDRQHVDLVLGRRESVVLSVDGEQPSEKMDAADVFSEQVVSIDGEWETVDDAGKALSLEISDWAHVDGWELFSGTVTYRTKLEVPEADEVWLDLGKVGDIAEVLVDGATVGTRMWAPYRIKLDGVDAGTHTVEVRVTNSMANAYEGMQMPSGLMGPVSVVVRTKL